MVVLLVSFKKIKPNRIIAKLIYLNLQGKIVPEKELA